MPNAAASIRARNRRRAGPSCRHQKPRGTITFSVGLRHQLQDVFGCSLDFRSSRSELGESVLARLHFQVMDGDEAAVATARVDRLIGHAFPGWAIIFPIDLDRQTDPPVTFVCRLRHAGQRPRKPVWHHPRGQTSMTIVIPQFYTAAVILVVSEEALRGL